MVGDHPAWCPLGGTPRVTYEPPEPAPITTGEQLAAALGSVLDRVEAVAVAEIAPGDALVLKLSKAQTRAALVELEATAEAVLPGVKVLILGDGVDLAGILRGTNGRG